MNKFPILFAYFEVNAEDEPLLLTRYNWLRLSFAGLPRAMSNVLLLALFDCGRVGRDLC
jgi:hypothetical protein